MTQRKKLIEVALPLEAINAASAREKSIRHGHPSTLHLWWARRPLAAARAVIFTSLVDDLYGDLNGKGSCSVPQVLDSEDSIYFCAFEEQVSGQPGDEIVDVITAQGEKDHRRRVGPRRLRRREARHRW